MRTDYRKKQQTIKNEKKQNYDEIKYQREIEEETV